MTKAEKTAAIQTAKDNLYNAIDAALCQYAPTDPVAKIDWATFLTNLLPLIIALVEAFSANDETATI
jgi:hypothetical protein